MLNECVREAKKEKKTEEIKGTKRMKVTDGERKVFIFKKSRDGERLSGSSAALGLIWQLLFHASVPRLVCLRISTACLMFYTMC